MKLLNGIVWIAGIAQIALQACRPPSGAAAIKFENADTGAPCNGRPATVDTAIYRSIKVALDAVVRRGPWSYELTDLRRRYGEPYLLVEDDEPTRVFGASRWRSAELPSVAARRRRPVAYILLMYNLPVQSANGGIAYSLLVEWGTVRPTDTTFDDGRARSDTHSFCIVQDRESLTVFDEGVLTE